MNEERVLYLTLILAGIPSVIGWLVEGGPAGAGVTICCLLVLAGIWGSLAGASRPQPTARLTRK